MTSATADSAGCQLRRLADSYTLERMTEYTLFMHADAPVAAVDAAFTWPTYLAKLRAAGVFQGDTAIDGGLCVS